LTFLARAEQLRDRPASSDAALKGAGVGLASAADEPGPPADDDSLLVSFASGTSADAMAAAQGIVWATDHGAKVINMSLGGPGASTVIDQAVSYAIAHEVVLVTAAGNDAPPALQYPAAPGVYGVTATDAVGKFAWFSNHGPWYALAAPGIGIRSTALGAGPAAAYTTGTGTSFSAPIVAGVMALVRERHPGPTAPATRSTWPPGATPCGSGTGSPPAATGVS
jgi:subtilisin family serine protease